MDMKEQKGITGETGKRKATAGLTSWLDKWGWCPLLKLVVVECKGDWLSKVCVLPQPGVVACEKAQQAETGFV